MVLTNHVLVDDEVKKKIVSLKNYFRETPNDVLRRVLKLKTIKKGNSLE